MSTAVEVVNQQESVKNLAAEEFTRKFERQTFKLAVAVIHQMNNQKLLRSQPFEAFSKLNLRSLSKYQQYQAKNMALKAIEVAEGDKTKNKLRLIREMDIKQHYKVELAASNSEILEWSTLEFSHLFLP